MVDLCLVVYFQCGAEASSTAQKTSARFDVDNFQQLFVVVRAKLCVRAASTQQQQQQQHVDIVVVTAGAAVRGTSRDVHSITITAATRVG